VDLPTLHRVRTLVALLVGVLIAGLTLTASIPTAHAANGTLSGTVTEAGTGVPLSGVAVEAFCWTVAGNDRGEVCGETQTGAGGTYSMSLPTGVYKVSFDAFPTHGRQFYGGGTDLGDPTSAEVLVPDGGAATGIGAALQPLRVVSGSVTGDGGPAAGLNVTAYQLSSDPSPTWDPVDGVVTGPDGTYALHLPDGTYRVGFSDARGPFRTEFFDNAETVEQADDIVVAGVAVGGINADLAVNSPITGSVTVDGINMPDVTVTAYHPDESEPSGWAPGKHTATGQDGRYALYLPDGTYRIQFQTFQARFDTVYYPEASTVQDAADVVVAGAEVPDISVAIVSGGADTGPAITGTVTLADTGEPVADVAVTAFRWNVLGGFWAEVRQRSTGPDGTYALFVPEGTYRIGFHDFEGRYRQVFYGGADTVEEATDVLQTGEGVAGVDVQLVENHSISGTITADPLPDLPPGVPPTLVTAWRWNALSFDWERVNSRGSTPDGQYVVYVPDGTYRIEFIAFSDSYRHPHFYDGSDNLGEATDVVVSGADVTGIDAHLVATSTEPPPSWSPPQTLSAAGRDGWGPQVAVGREGTAIAVWFRRDGVSSRVQASIRPPGQPWSSPSALSAPGQDAFDPQVAIGADGMAVAAWRSWDGSHYRVQASTRPASGSWSAPSTLSAAGADAWDPQVTVGDKGAAVVVWGRSAGITSQVQASTRAKGAWSAPTTLSTGVGDARDPQVALGSNGTAVAVWSRSDGSAYRVQASSRGGNGSWSSPVNLSGAGADAEDPQVAVGSDGAATVVWRGWDGSNERVQTALRSAAGAWSTPAFLSPAGRDGHDPQVSVDANGITTAVWARWDGSSDRVQTASRAKAGTWSAPKTLSTGGLDANAPQVAAGANGAATALWRQSADFGEQVVAALRRPDGTWSTPTELTFLGPPAGHPQVAAGPEGTVAAVWEQRIGDADRIQGVVRSDPAGGNHCVNEFGVDLNLTFGVLEQLVAGPCRTVSARAKWRPLTFWTMNTVFDVMPPDYVPAGPTPLEDLAARLASVTVVIDRDTKREKTVVFSPAAALRTDLTLDDYVPFEFSYPIAATLPLMASLPAGDHTLRVIWTLSSEHCDGFGDVPGANCLASGDNVLLTRTFTVGSS
jgi:hypothetical protein